MKFSYLLTPLLSNPIHPLISKRDGDAVRLSVNMDACYRYPLNPSMVHPKSENVTGQRLYVGALGDWRNGWDFRCRLSGEWKRLMIGVQLPLPEQSEYLVCGYLRSLAESKCSFIGGGGGH